MMPISYGRLHLNGRALSAKMIMLAMRTANAYQLTSYALFPANRE